MKLFSLICSLVLLCGCYSAQNTSPAVKADVPKTVTLVCNGQSSFSIVLPAKGDPLTQQILREAATALQSAFREGTGVTLPIVIEKKCCSRKECSNVVKGIYLGACDAAAAAGLCAKDFKTAEYLIAERNGSVFILGKDGPSGLRGKSYIRYYTGTAKGVAGFMEKILGTRILYPGEVGRTTPRKNTVTIAAGTSMRVKSLLILGTSRHHELIYDMANNDFGYPGIHLYGGHSYYSAVPEKVYGKTHPEYFMLRGNKRASAGNHLCISNPKVQELIYLEAKKKLQAGAWMVELAQTDGYQPCECKKCADLYGVKDHGEKLWILHRAIAERLYKELPDKQVLIISYGPTAKPPRTFNAFPPNTMVEICYYDDATLAAWKKITVPRGFTTYMYNWGSYKLPGYTPVQGARYPAEQVKKFHKFGIKGVYRSGFGASFGLEAPVYHMYGKLWDDPAQDYRKILDDFYKHAFGESALSMTKFYNMLYERLDAFAALDTISSGKALLPRNPRAWIGFVYTPEFLESLENLLRTAESDALNYKVKRRLQLVRLEFDYLKNLATIVHHYHSYRLSPDRAGFEKIARAVEQRNKMIDSYFDAKGKKKSINNWPEMVIRGNAAKALLMANGRLAAPMGAPLNWNIPALRKSGVLPGALRKKVNAYPYKGGSLNDPDKGAWQKLPYTKLEGIQAGSVKQHTWFKVMYDKKNLYVAFRAELPAKRTYVPQGHDGSAPAKDCLEFFIDPAARKEVYYHFIWNPVPNSTYDAARGLITDPLDPKFNTFDRSWNGKWQVKNFRKGSTWYAVLVLPYTTVKATAPKKGSRWLLNIGRTDYFSAKSEPELSLWSPNLENMTFHDPECFGEVIFQ